MGIPLYLVDKNKEKLNAHDLIELGRNCKKFWLQLIRDSLQNHLHSSVSTTHLFVLTLEYMPLPVVS